MNFLGPFRNEIMSAIHTATEQFTQKELDTFRNDGFLICRGLMPEEYLITMKAVAERDAAGRLGDIEYEADVRYPGAPESLEAEGGRTIRRLRQAFSRDSVFSRLVKEPFLLKRLQQVLGGRVVMPLAHHNCIMTKSPQFSSDSGWHQDIRYWSFEKPNLVNAWIALTSESLQNGCLQLLPGTQRAEVEPNRLNDQLFLRTELQVNHSWLDSAIAAELSPGDVLFFHACCFHSATRNYSDQTKCSAVFTFRNLDNPPLDGSRSAAFPELLLS